MDCGGRGAITLCENFYSLLKTAYNILIVQGKLGVCVCVCTCTSFLGFQGERMTSKREEAFSPCLPPMMLLMLCFI